MPLESINGRAAAGVATGVAGRGRAWPGVAGRGVARRGGAAGGRDGAWRGGGRGGARGPPSPNRHGSVACAGPGAGHAKFWPPSSVIRHMRTHIVEDPLPAVGSTSITLNSRAREARSDGTNGDSSHTTSHLRIWRRPRDSALDPTVADALEWHIRWRVVEMTGRPKGRRGAPPPCGVRGLAAAGPPARPRAAPPVPR